METFSELLAICARNSPSPMNSPHKAQAQAQAEFIQHEYIQYYYSSGIHKYVNIG